MDGRRVTILGMALGALVGFAMGLLGGGGSILTVPIFVYVLGFGAKAAVAMSLLTVGLVSLLGAWGHWRLGNVNVRLALLFGSVAMVGTYIGARLAVFVSGSMQLALFSIVMLTAAGFMFRKTAPAPAMETTNRALPFPLIAVEGMTVGILTGLVGVGGGFLIVPALVLLGNVSMKQAVGTSLVIIAMKSATGFLGYLGQVEVPWMFVGVFVAVAMIGVFIGSHAVRTLSQATLTRAFAVFLLMMGSSILYANRGAFLGETDHADRTGAEQTSLGANDPSTHYEPQFRTD